MKKILPSVLGFLGNSERQEGRYNLVKKKITTRLRHLKVMRQLFSEPTLVVDVSDDLRVHLLKKIDDEHKTNQFERYILDNDDTSISMIGFEGSKIQNKTLKVFYDVDLSQLYSLGLRCENIDNDVYDYLKNLKIGSNLSNLDLTNTKIDKNGLKKILGIPYMKNIDSLIFNGIEMYIKLSELMSLLPRLDYIGADRAVIIREGAPDNTILIDDRKFSPTEWRDTISNPPLDEASLYEKEIRYLRHKR